MAEEFKILDYVELSKELKTYEVELLEPSSYPTPKINRRLIRIQSYKDRVQSMIEDAITNRNIVEKRVDQLQHEIDREKERLMAKDSEILELSSADKRTAAVNLKLKDKLDALLAANNLFLDAKDFESKARLRYANLESANKNMSRLISTYNVMFIRGEMKPAEGAQKMKLNLGGEEE